MCGGGIAHTQGIVKYSRDSDTLISQFLKKKINIDDIIITGDDKKGIAEMIGFLQISL